VKNGITVILVLLFCIAVFLGCGKTPEFESDSDVKAPDDFTADATDDPGSEVPGGPEPDESASKLMNYKEWVDKKDGPHAAKEIELDIIENYGRMEGDLVAIGVNYPRVWPEKQLGSNIPEYTGTGYMQHLFVVHPNMSYRPEDMQIVIVTVNGIELSDVDEYIEKLDGFQKNDEKAKELYSGSTQAGFDIRRVEAFEKGDSLLYLVIGDDSDGVYLHFNVYFTRDEYKFDTSKIERTNLRNSHQWAESNGIALSEAGSLDSVSASGYDKSGAYTTTYTNPSKWPREVFGDLIPIYAGEGVLRELEVTIPKEGDPPSEALMAVLYFDDHIQFQLDDYARYLIDFGYTELPQERWLLFNILSVPGQKCYVGVEGTQAVIILTFEGRGRNFYEQGEDVR
jgi:hypothetical protein